MCASFGFFGRDSGTKTRDKNVCVFFRTSVQTEQEQDENWPTNTSQLTLFSNNIIMKASLDDDHHRIYPREK